MGDAPFRFIDLFAGVGGFHAALGAFGGDCVYAVEIDKQAAAVYRRNWGYDPLGDITKDATDEVMNVPEHEILAAGFPCQPFSKSGAQHGMDETRGTLFWNIARIIEVRRPKIVILENVRNLAGPRHEHEWQVIIETLQELGYRVAEEPAVFSPHLLPPERGGRPQVRERVFITATLIPEQMRDDPALNIEARPVASPTQRIDGFDPKQEWHLDDLLDDSHNVPGCNLTQAETLWIDAWDDFVKIMRKSMDGRHLPGFPIWLDSWRDFEGVWEVEPRAVPDRLVIPRIDPELPAWKRSHLAKNYDLFSRHHKPLRRWADKWGVFTAAFPPSRRKLEWQAQETASLWGYGHALPAFRHSR